MQFTNSIPTPGSFLIHIRKTVATSIAISDNNMQGNLGIAIKSNMWYVKTSYVG